MGHHKLKTVQKQKAFPHQHTQFVVTPTTEWIDSNHQFSDHLCINTTAHPVLVGRCNPYQVFACMVANSTLPKWQCNEGPHVFPTGGPNQQPQPSMATLLNRMRLCPANVIFRNVFLSPSVKQVTTLPWHFTPEGALFGPIYGIYVG